jgi:hypothetical protein
MLHIDGHTALPTFGVTGADLMGADGDREALNAARNLVEIISNEVRNDSGDYRIRIYTLGMGELVRYDLGTRPEKSEDILKRIANDPLSPDFNKDQLEGKYYFAQTEADVAPAFQALQNQIIRLSK